jgi:hypothetical protein
LQAQAEQHNFPTYNSPFQLYPLLRSRSRPISSSGDSGSHQTSTSGHSSTSSHPLFSSLPSKPSSSSLPLHVPDLTPLKLATNIKFLDPNKRVCQYEVPGGGICRDESCDDVHLGRNVGGDIVGQGIQQGMVTEPSGTSLYVLGLEKLIGT